MAEINLSDKELFEKDSEASDADISKFERVGARRPRYVRNDVGPFTTGDVVTVLVLKNDKEIERITYPVKAEVLQGNEIRMPLTLDFVEMKSLSNELVEIPIEAKLE